MRSGRVAASVVRRDSAHRVADDDRREEAKLLHEHHDIVTHQFEGIIPGPLTATVSAGVRRDDPKVLAEHRCDVPPAQA